jgi:hypothetical protein
MQVSSSQQDARQPSGDPGAIPVNLLHPPVQDAEKHGTELCPCQFNAGSEFHVVGAFDPLPCLAQLGRSVRVIWRNLVRFQAPTPPQSRPATLNPDTRMGGDAGESHPAVNRTLKLSQFESDPIHQSCTRVV